MYHTKKEVDSHVRSVIKKLQTERERQLRGLTIAKMYFRVNEFSLAEQYALSFLKANENSEEAHKLLGQTYVHRRQPEKALQHFQQSLYINSKQSDVIIEVCKLLNDDKHFNPNKASYWCDLAESEKVNDEAVFNLRLKLLRNDETSSNKFEEMIQKQIVAQPSNMTLRVRLLQYYVNQKKILDAFKYILNFEMKKNFEFCHDADWYNVVWMILTKYELLPNIKKDWDYWLLLIMCLERQVQLSFNSKGQKYSDAGKETAKLLSSLDQYLQQLSQVIGKFSVQVDLAEYFLNHYRGQLLLHSVALMFCREIVQNKNRWKDTTIMALPLMLLAYQVENPLEKEPWVLQCDEQGKTLVQMWKREAAFRCYQVGRTLLSYLDDGSSTDDLSDNVKTYLGNQKYLWSNADDLLYQIRSSCSNKNWRKELYSLLFCNPDQKIKEKTSFLTNCSKLSEPEYEMPNYVDLDRFAELAHYLKPQSLAHMVYLSLGQDDLSTVKVRYFSGLKFSAPNLAACGADSLSQLDIDSFLYCTTISAKRTLEVERENQERYYSTEGEARGKPGILLFENIQTQLCTDDQEKWWTAAYNVYKNIPSENLMETRQILQCGIEAVRGLNGPKIDLIIVFKLGKIFVDRAKDNMKTNERSDLEARAENIYRCGLNMLRMANKGILEPFWKHFDYAKAKSPEVERQISAAAEEAISFLAARYFKKGAYEEFVQELSGVQLPFAAFLQAEAYRKLDEISKTPKASKQMYMERASECLNQTLEYLKYPQIDPNHPLNAIIHSEIRKVQQNSIRYNTTEYYSPSNGAGGHSLHNNSSAYEDAEDGVFGDNSILRTPNITLNRSRRDSNITSVLKSSLAKNAELENLIKQMSSTLTLVKDEILDKVRPELSSMNKEMSCLKDKMSELEDMMKKSRISSSSPSRDDVANSLDLYALDEALQNNMYANTNMMFPNMNSVPNSMALMNNPYVNQQGNQAPRLMAPNPMQINVPFNPAMFNPNYPMNFNSPFMMGNAGAATAAGMPALGQPPLGPQALGQAALGPAAAGTMPPQPSLLGTPRPPLAVPFMDPSNINFNVSPFQLPTTPDSRTYAALSQPSMATAIPSTSGQNTQFPMSMPASNSLKDINSFAPSVQPPLSASLASTTTSVLNTGSGGVTSTSSTPVSSTITFNKALNNQPVEKGPPANVVITSSDPLPNPNVITQQQTQQPTLSVTIPSHHIKPSLVAQTNDTGNSLSTFSAPPAANTVTSTPIGGPAVPAFGSQLQTSTKPGYFTISSSKDSTTVNDSKPKPVNKPTTEDHIHSSKATDDEHDPEYQPIIPLPAEVEVRTGEEDEEVVFSNHAKLSRWVSGEWKERCVGDLKILKNKDGLSRIVMRQDQTHKLCANHRILKELIITTPKKGDKDYIWTAQDFSEDEMKPEKFYAQFKSSDVAKQFFAVFQKAQLEHEASEKKNLPKEMKPPTSTTSISKALTKPLDKTKDEKPAVAPTFTLAKNIAPISTSTPAANKVETSSSSTVLAAPTTVSTPSGETTTLNSSVSKNLFGALSSKTSTAPTTTAASNTTGGSVFSGFSFGTPTGSGAAAGSTMGTGSFTTIFSNIGKSNTPQAPSPFSSANLPNIFQSSILGSPSTTDGVAASTLSSASAANRSTVEEPEEEYVPTAEFNPVIPLPDLVEVATGEENELVLFEHRAKLLRYDKEAGEWKERGLGNIKLLQDKNDVNKVRLVMRREQIHKLCCNQRLYKDTQFKYAKNSQVALTWAGQDFSENELVTEMLTIRFKTADICKRFHEAILKAQEKMTDDLSGPEDKNEVKAASATKNSGAKGPVVQKEGFGDKFKPKAGSWTCDACYITNEGDKLYCAACDSPKDSTVPKKEAAPTNAFAPSGKTTFSFGFPAAASKAPEEKSTTVANVASQKAPTVTTNFFGAKPPTASETTVNKDAGPVKGFGNAFKPKPGSWECKACYLTNPADVQYCKACQEAKDDSVPKKEPEKNDLLALSNPNQKFVFGFNNAAATPQDSSTASKSSLNMNTTTKSEPVKGGLFESTSTGESKTFTFTPPQATSTSLASLAATNSIQKEKFTFTLHSKAMEKPSGDGSLNFSLTMKSPAKSAAGSKAEDDDDQGDHDGLHEEEENNAYFAPVIPLPDKVDVTTGEESEELLYVHRAKLFRYTDHQWKERGVGNLKILRHKESRKLRVVMRRDQVLKICLNHVLNDAVEYKPKDDKSWLFAVNDYSEGEIELQQFALRFKNSDIAEQFMSAIKASLDGSAKAIEDSASENNSTSDSKAAVVELKKTSAEKSSSTASKTADAKVEQKNQLLTETKESDGKKPSPVDDTTEETEPCGSCYNCTPDKFPWPKPAKDIELFLKTDTNPLPLELPKLKLNKPRPSVEVTEVATPKANSTKEAQPKVSVANTTSTPTTMPSIFKGSQKITSSAPPTIATSTIATTTSTIGKEKSANDSTFSFASVLQSTAIGDKTVTSTSSPATPVVVSTSAPEKSANNSTFSFASAFQSTTISDKTFGDGSPLMTGGNAENPLGKMSIFGGNANAGKTFGTDNSMNLSGSIFGSATAPSKGSEVSLKPSIFGSALANTQQNNSGKENKSIFGSLNQINSADTTTGSTGAGSKTTEKEKPQSVSIFSGTGFGGTGSDSLGGNGGSLLNGSSFFGNSTQPLFGSGAPIFGSPRLTIDTNKDSQDANKNASPALNKSIFGTNSFSFNQTPVAATKDGNDSFKNTPTTTGSIFGGSLFKQSTTTTSTFDDANQNLKENSESNNKTSTPSSGVNITPVFGNAFNTKPIFGEVGSRGGSLFGTPDSSTQKQTSANNNSPAPTIFGSIGNSTNPISFADLNSNKESESLFGAFKANQPDSSTMSLSGASMTFADLSNQNTLDFASLASKASTDANTSIKMKGKLGVVNASSFIGLTEQQDAFSVKKDSSTANNNDSVGASGGVAGADGGAENDDNYDPHYEPIIALPNEVVVSTGEEDETKLFGERAVLYRFDSTNKEWKERGTGELKILSHPTRNTYRMVMRREQIYKLVLNHFINGDFIFDNMSKNPKSFVWATINFAESQEGEVEKLAVRFKKVEIAEEFRKVLNKCISDAKKQNN